MIIMNIMTKLIHKNMYTTARISLTEWFFCLLACLLYSANMALAQETSPKKIPQNSASVGQPSENEAYEKLLQKADDMLKNGQAVEAYTLLEPLEYEHASEERFDYLVGIAALDSGKPDKATLAFERVLAINPASLAARLEMGRAYFQLGDKPRAKTEFEIVQKLSPSEQGRHISQKYLDEISLHESGKQTFSSGYIEITTGHDSNVNNSTSQSQIFVDAIAGNTTLDPVNIKTSDQYAGVAAGGKVIHKPNPTLELFAGADLRKRNYIVQKNFDTTGLDANAGMAFNIKAERLQLSALSGQFNLGGAHYSDSRGIKGDWRHVFSPSNQLYIMVQSMEYKFVEVAMKPNDYSQQINNIGSLHVLTDGKTNFSCNFYWGNEQDTSTLITSSTPNGGRTDGAKYLNGFRLGAQTTITEKTTLFTSAAMQSGNFSKINPLFLRQRKDNLQDLIIGMHWRGDKLWALRTQLNYVKNNSNIAIYDYDRLEISVTVHRDFR